MNQAVILCGGRGTRLRPLTNDLPKPLLKIGDKPILERLILLLAEHEVKEIFLAVSYLGEKIEAYFGDGRQWGVDIYYSYDEQPLGGAGAVKLLEDKLDATFAVLNGDVLTNVNLTKMVEFHQQKGGIATLLVHKTDHPYDSDLVEFNENGLVTRFFRPKPGDKFKPVSKTGTHIFEPGVLRYIPEGKKYSLEKQLIPKLLKKEKQLYAYYSEAYSKDMGTPERLKRVREDFEQGLIKINED